MKKLLFFSTFFVVFMLCSNAQSTEKTTKAKPFIGYNKAVFSNSDKIWNSFLFGFVFKEKSSVSLSYLRAGSSSSNSIGLKKERKGYSLLYKYSLNTDKKLNFDLIYKIDYLIINSFSESSYWIDQYTQNNLFYYDYYKFLNNSIGLGVNYNITDYLQLYLKFHSGVSLPHYTIGMESSTLKSYEYEFRSKIGIRKEFIQTNILGINIFINKSLFQLF